MTTKNNTRKSISKNIIKPNNIKLKKEQKAIKKSHVKKRKTRRELLTNTLFEAGA